MSQYQPPAHTSPSPSMMPMSMQQQGQMMEDMRSQSVVSENHRSTSLQQDPLGDDMSETGKHPYTQAGRSVGSSVIYWWLEWLTWDSLILHSTSDFAEVPLWEWAPHIIHNALRSRGQLNKMTKFLPRRMSFLERLASWENEFPWAASELHIKMWQRHEFDKFIISSDQSF